MSLVISKIENKTENGSQREGYYSILCQEGLTNKMLFTERVLKSHKHTNTWGVSL